MGKELHPNLLQLPGNIILHVSILQDLFNTPERQGLPSVGAVDFDGHGLDCDKAIGIHTLLLHILHSKYVDTSIP